MIKRKTLQLPLAQNSKEYPLSDKDKVRFWSHVNFGQSDECWNWKICRFSSGYGQFHSRFANRNYRAHQIALHLSGVTIPSSMIVMHTCDNRACCNPNHLKVASNSDNMSDMVQKGRSPYGERNAACKLSNSEVIAIRALKSEGWRTKDICEQFQMSRTAIKDICAGRTWQLNVAKA